MIRQRLTVLFALFALALAGAVRAQELTADKFRTEFNQGLQLNDEKIADKAMKRGSRHAIAYYEELWWEVRSGKLDSESKCIALMASWKRCFENTETLEKLQRWVDLCSKDTYDQLQKIRTNSAKLWRDYETVAQNLKRDDFVGLMNDYETLAKAAEAIGHYMEAAELWALASVIGSKMPDRKVEDRERVLFEIEQSLAARDQWGYVFDEHYLRNREFLKGERVQIEEAKKNAEKRQAEGYDANAKGIDALLMPNAVALKSELEFEALKDWEKELDYGPNNGPVPAFWWICSLGAPGTNRKVEWFRARDVYVHRTSAAKFVMSLDPSDASKGDELEAGPRAKPSVFHLDVDKKLPYAMFFWLGSDREFVNQAECNLSPSNEVANLYYRSASSWVTTVDKTPLVLYDDNASGAPGDGDPFAAQFKSPLLGDPTGDGAIVPLFDSMRLGKGERVPYSQFVQLPTGWHHMEVFGGTTVSLRPLNPEYVKTGKIKMTWTGPKTSAPRQLVVRGKGDFQNAYFDVASGKEIEVPAGEYSVVYGRIVNGKGARVQTATIYPGPKHETFVVEAGKTQKLDMGAPFHLEFTRQGDKNASIDALTIHATERSGCIVGVLHGSTFACEVLAAKAEDGKGAKVVDEFVPFTDPELVNKAAQHYAKVGLLAACFPMPKGYQKGEMVLSLKLPEDGMKLGLAIKKHPLFGKIDPIWK